MDFDLSAEQQLLRDNVARLMKDRYGFEARSAYQKEAKGWSDEADGSGYAGRISMRAGSFALHAYRF